MIQEDHNCKYLKEELAWGAGEDTEKEGRRGDGARGAAKLRKDANRLNIKFATIKSAEPVRGGRLQRKCVESSRWQHKGPFVHIDEVSNIDFEYIT